MKILILTFILALTTNTNADQKPNFLFILVDDLGWSDVSYQGSKFYETPNIDKLANKSTIFNNAYAACTVCSPTRGSIMTGKYPARFGITDHLHAPQPETHAKSHHRKLPIAPAPFLKNMKQSEITIAETLKNNGYATFFAGKWHLGSNQAHWPENQGFDINIGGHAAGGPYRGGKYFSPFKNPKIKPDPKGQHLPDRLATETAKFIKQSKKPFLAYLSFYSVHTPLMTKHNLKKKYQTKARNTKKNFNIIENSAIFQRNSKVRQVQNHPVYAGMIETMDDAVGKVLTALKETGKHKNTVVIFMSDNGGLSSSEGSPTSNLPLRGGKGWAYEGGTRVPMFIYWPNVSKPTIINTPVISTDFYPTMLEMANIKPNPKQHADGKSLAKLIKSGTMKTRPIFWHYPHWGNQGGTPYSSVRLGDWKYIKFYDGREELYNLTKDIGETKNQVKINPEKAAELKNTLDKWIINIDAKLPTILKK